VDVTRRCITAVVVVILAGLAIATASVQATTPTRERLWTAMDRFAECRHVGGGKPTGHTSSVATNRGPTYVSWFDDSAHLTVTVAPPGHSHVYWTTRNGVRQFMFRFNHLRNVAGRLDQATLERGCTAERSSGRIG
jgi:hypothetical protein